MSLFNRKLEQPEKKSSLADQLREKDRNWYENEPTVELRTASTPRRAGPTNTSRFRTLGRKER